MKRNNKTGQNIKKIMATAMAVVMLGAGTMSGVSASSKTVTEKVGGYSVTGVSSATEKNASGQTTSGASVICYIDTSVKWRDVSQGKTKSWSKSSVSVGGVAVSKSVKEEDYIKSINSIHRATVPNGSSISFQTSVTVK